MTQAKNYSGIDGFRLVAACMVVAIHTALFSAFSPVSDALFTYGLFRVAVPFFFLCSGFFAPVQQRTSFRPLARQSLRLLRLYLLATLLYLPLSLRGGFAPLQFLYGLLWQGTFYHLWYFPAAILGLWLAGLAFRYLPFTFGCLFMAALYILGLMGDNYLLPLQAFPALGTFSQGLTTLFGFTRNGLFFAAPFIYAGMLLRARMPARQGQPRKRALTLCVLLVGLVGIAGEALGLYFFTGAMPQGSMYIFLPMAAIALFCLLLSPQVRVPKAARQAAMLVYILHPWCIAVLYSAAGLVGLPNAMQTHSGLFFLAAVLASLGLAFAIAQLQAFIRAVRQTPPRAAAHIKLGSLRHNLHEIQGLLPQGCEVMAVVKADAYGHGAAPVARALQRQGVRRFAVATFGEGAALRLHGIRGDILVLGRIPGSFATATLLLGLTATVVDEAHLQELQNTNLPIQVHLKIDTGMHRLGLAPDAQFIAGIYKQSPLRITGIYSHLATADSLLPRDIAFAERQAAVFFTLIDNLNTQGIAPGLIHLQSSYGVLNHPQFTKKCSCVRVGLALYGATQPGTRLSPTLQPVLSLQARIIHIQTLPANTYAGYSHAFYSTKASTLATVAIGYADGLPRNAVGAAVLVGSHKATIVATCMDTCLVDITHTHGIQAGDTVCFIGGSSKSESHAKPLTAADLASTAGTIPNEILSRLGKRVKRLYSIKGREE